MMYVKQSWDLVAHFEHFRVDAHRSPLAAHILATNRRMLVNNAHDASPQECSDSKMTL